MQGLRTGHLHFPSGKLRFGAVLAPVEPRILKMYSEQEPVPRKVRWVNRLEGTLLATDSESSRLARLAMARLAIEVAEPRAGFLRPRPRCSVNNPPDSLALHQTRS